MTDIIQYKEFIADIHFSAEDEVFYGKLVGIKDLVNFEADSVKGLKKAFKEAVEDYLEVCKQSGKDPDKTYKGSFNVRIPTHLHREAAIYAAIKNVSLNDFVKFALDFTLSKEKEKVSIAK